MLKLGNLVYIFIFLFSYSCNQKAVKIEYLQNESEELNISSLFSSIQTIVLETRDDALIGEISLVRYGENRIFILDKRRALSVFVFDGEGNFIKKIEGGWTGPGYLNFPDHLVVLKDELMIYDPRQNKVMVFSLDGSFKHESSLKDTGIYALDMIANKGEAVFFDFYSEPNSLFRLVDVNGEEVVNQLNEFEEVKVVSGRRLPYVSLTKDNKIRVQLPGSFCYYVYDKAGLSNYEVLDLGQENNFQGQSEVVFKDYYEELVQKELSMLRGEFVDLTGHSLFSIQQGAAVIFSIYDKEENKAYPIRLKNDLGGICPDIESLPAYNVHPGELTLGFFPGDLKLIYAQSDKQQELLDFFKTKAIEDSDNPILFRLIE